MKFFKLFILSILLVIAQSLFAIPVKPRLTKTLTLTDGTTIVATLVGDEHGHYWLGQDGKAYQALNGSDTYQLVDAQSIISKAQVRRAAANQRRINRMPRKKIGDVGSISGDKKGIIILVNFKDKSFTASQSDFYNLANTVNYNSGKYKGSMYDYFYAQSEGQFRLTFDVVGPYTVSQNCAYYGGNDSSGDDLRPGNMVKEAVQLANGDVNFADYDWDNDGYVDQVYVVYAGKGEADGGDDDTIWPHEWELSGATGSYITLDGKKINTYACGGEQNGSTGATAGIGTMCHEFSHCLGYPDFYDTDYSGGQGMFEWDLMDSGSYNDDGYQPAGYTSYERWVAGWKTPITLEATQNIVGMAALQNGGNSYIIYNKANNNEYYLLENRQKVGWDASLPGKGLLILHVDYNSSAWSNNTPNDDPSHQRMTWIPADNKYQYTTYQGTKYYTEAGAKNDPFPYGNVNAFGKNTTPAATLYNKNSDNTYYLDSSVENITQNSDGTISFLFRGLSNVEAPTFSPNGGTYDYGSSVNVTISCGTSGASIYYTTDGSVPTTSSTLYTNALTFNSYTVLKAIAVKDGELSGVTEATYSFNEPIIVADESLTFSTYVGSSQTLPLEVLTENLTQDITLTLSDANNVFSLSTNTISKSLQYATVDVTFTPAVVGTYTGSITLSSTGADPVTVQLSATAKEPSSSNPNTTTFKLVTSTDDLESGMRYIIGCGSAEKAAGALSSQILSSEDVTVDNDVITKTNDVAVFVLEGNQTDGWTFKNESNNQYLYATDVKNLAYGNTANTWTLSDGTAGVVMTYSNDSYGTMLYNTSSPRFTTYISSPTAAMIQANLYIEYDNGTTPVTKQDVTMSFSPSSVEITQGGIFTVPSLTTDPTGLTVTYSSSNTNVATVNTSTGAVTVLGTGTTTITASFAGNYSYNAGSASYTLTVNAASIPSVETLLYEGVSKYSSTGDNNTAFSTSTSTSNTYLDYSGWSTLTKVYPGGTDKAYSNGGCLKFGSGSDAGVMTTGNISLTGSGTLTFYLKKYSNDTGTMNVTVTGATADVTSFTPQSDWTLCTVNLTNATGNVTVGLATSSKRAYVDEITLVSGSGGITPSKDDVTMSFSPSSVEITQGDIFTAPSLTTDPTGLTVTYSSSNTNVAAVNTSTGAVTVVGTGTTTITASFAGNDSYNSGSASYTLTVNADTNAPGTQNNPYTVAGAIAYINTLGSSTSPTDVYVSGIISQVDSYNSTYKSITYWISDDGTTTTQMEVYSGKGLNSADFSASDDLHVGDEVTVCGKVKLFKSTPEFNYNNYLVAFNRPQKSDVTMSFSPSSVELTYGDAFVKPTLTTDPADLTVSYQSSNTNVATIDASGDVTIVGTGTATITATFAGNDSYNEGSASYTITVNEAVTLPEMPDDVEISSVSSTSFTVSWEAMPNATSYDIDVVQGSSFDASTSVAILESDFSDTSDWTLSGTGTYTGAGYYGAGSPSIKFDGTGDYAISPDFGSGTKLQFWAYGNGGSGSTFAISGLVNSSWTNIETVSIAQGGDTYEVNLPSGTSQVRFDFTKSVNCALDDVIVYGAGGTIESLTGYPKSVGNVTSYTVTDLTPETQYAVRVRAVNSAGNSDWSTTITCTTTSQSTPPTIAYYASADGKQGSALKTAMCVIILPHTQRTYENLWTDFQSTDVHPDGDKAGKIWDMYSNTTNYDPNCSHTNSGEGDGFNREHSFPKSWFGGENVMPMFTDLHHIYPTDSYINGRRSNYPYGETDGETYKSNNDFSKLGTCTYPGYTGKVFEPADEYKGDFARTYFYMVTCYENELPTWVSSYSSSTDVEEVLDGSTYPAFTTWTKNMLMEWAKNDPVSEKETNRNNAVYAIQGNRNPFIDYPGLQEYIWGFMTTSTFSYDNYQEPVYTTKQDVTMSFSPTTATATVGQDFTEPTLTTNPANLTVTYSSSAPGVATVDASTGEVTPVAAGTTTITATFAGNDTYNSGSASYTLTVSDSSTPVTGSGNYELVTDASTLAAGDKIIIVNTDAAKALSTTQNDNNRGATGVTISNNTITPGSEVQIITLEKSGDNFLFNVGADGYLYAASSSSNYLRTEETADDNAEATISIASSGNATITFQGTNTRNLLRYNSSSTIFSCYGSNSDMALPQIYRETVAQQEKDDSDLAITSNSSVTLDMANSTTSTITWTTSSTGAMSFASSDESVATVSNAGVITAVGPGSATITVTQAADDSYKASDAKTVNVTVNGVNSISLSATSIEETFSNNPSSITAIVPTDNYDGEVTAVSSNEYVATVAVSGNIITFTPHAVGTATITVTAGTGTYYPETAQATCEVEFTAPEGETTAPGSGTSGTVLLFGESFGDNSGSARAWDDSYSEKTGVSDVYSGITGYTVSNAKQSKNTMGSVGSALVSGQGKTGTFVVGPLNVASYSNLSVDNYFGMSSGTWNNGSYMRMSFSTDGNDYTEVSRTDSNTPTGAVSPQNSNLVKASYNLPQTAQSSTLYLKFEFYCYQINKNNQEIGQAYFDEVNLSGESSINATTTVIINKYGYATYCSVNPIDFSDTEGYTAWRISEIANDGTITFTKIEEAIKGGQGVLLYNKDADGVNTSEVTITFGDGTTLFSNDENKLRGTTAPTYFAQGAIYGLSGTTFLKNNAGNVRANKAYINAEDVNVTNASPTKTFTFVFNDPVTGISEIQNVGAEEFDAIFNLSGQRLNKPQRGVNIINGRKVLVK